MILKGLFKVVHALECFSNLNVPDQVVSKVARTVTAAEKMGIQIRWLDKVIGNFSA